MREFDRNQTKRWNQEKSNHSLEISKYLLFWQQQNHLYPEKKLKIS